MNTWTTADQYADQYYQSPDSCTYCGSSEIEEGFELLLCTHCRTLLARRPFPVWIKVSCIILLVILVSATFRSLDAFRAGIAFERGEQAERQRNFVLAADYYEKVAERFPDSTQVLVRLAITRFQAGKLPEAIRVLDRLKDRKLSRQQVAELNQVFQAHKAPQGDE